MRCSSRARCKAGCARLTGWRAREYWFPDIRSLGGAIVLFTLVLYPYVYLTARAAFLQQTLNTLEAARLLGYGTWGSVWRIMLPLARPGIVAGTALAALIGNAGRFRHRGLLRHPDLFHRHLPRVVLAGRQERSGPVVPPSCWCS
ncbi:ABC transporter permease subunit [Cupriavidus basilensis]